jgi:tetratricopeptide (TPR) repeat protein
MSIINMNDAIERYLSGMMTKEEELWLKAEINGNPELGRELELRRRTNKILSDMSVIELRSKLEAIEMKKRAANPVHRTVVRAARVAAAVAGAAIISSAIYFPNRNISPEKLYSQHFKRYEAVTYTRSAHAATNALFASAMEAIRAKNYDQAINYLDQITNTDQANIEAIFMLGVANMYNKNYQKAEALFENVIKQNDNLFIEDANWFLGLCYMVNEEKEKAIKQFEYISGTKSKYSKEARKLIRRLD